MSIGGSSPPYILDFLEKISIIEIAMFCSPFSFLYWKHKIKPKIFCILPTYLYLCVWNWLLPFPDILVKTKHWLLLWSSRKSVGNFLSEYTTAPIMVGFICGKHRWTSRQICRVNVHARYRVWAFLYLTVVQIFPTLATEELKNRTHPTFVSFCE